MKRIRVLFDDKLLKRLDADAEVRKASRSAVLRRAAAAHLRKRRAEQIAEAYRRGYADGGLGHEFEGWENQGSKPRRDLDLRLFASGQAALGVVLTRPQVIGLLQTVMVAPVTLSVRGLPSEVIIGVEEGSAADLGHVQTVDRLDWSGSSAISDPRRCGRSAGHSP